MGNKVKAKARHTRGSGNEEALAGLQGILVTNYEDTKAEYDALEDDWKARFDTVLGELADPFKQGKLMVEMQINTLQESDCEQKLE